MRCTVQATGPAEWVGNRAFPQRKLRRTEKYKMSLRALIDPYEVKSTSDVQHDVMLLAERLLKNTRQVPKVNCSTPLPGTVKEGA